MTRPTKPQVVKQKIKNNLCLFVQVSFVETLEDSNESLFALSLRDEIIIYEARRNVFREMDKISGTKITSLGCCNGLLAVGWAPFGFGIGTEFTAKVGYFYG